MSIIKNIFSRSDTFGLSNPATWFTDLNGAKSIAGVSVNATTISGLPAVWRGVSLLGGILGSLPLQVLSEVTGNKTQNREHPLYPLLHWKPNRFMTSFTWRQISQAHAILWGNAYSKIVWSGGARPLSITPIHPRNVEPVIDGDRLLYKITKEGGTIEILDSSEVLHIKGLGDDGITGKSIFKVLRENFGSSLATQEAGANFWGKGAKLDGAITKEGQMSEKQGNTLRRTWNDRHGGAEGERIMLLDDGMKYEAIGVPPEESQFIETKKFGVTDVARILNIPPPLLFDLEKATFANIEKLILSFVKFDLVPWLTNWESEMNTKLFRNDELGKVFAEFNVDGLLRGDTEARAALYQTLIQNSVMRPNDAARFENLPTYRDGDKYYHQANVIEVGTQINSLNGQKNGKHVVES